MARVIAETSRPNVYREFEWPGCASPDCENLRCLWSGTELCYRCAEQALGKAEMESRYALTHGAREGER